MVCENEVIRKAMAFAYRQWSFYWGLKAIKCRISEDEAFVEFEKSVLYWTENKILDIERLGDEFRKEMVAINNELYNPLLEVFNFDLGLHIGSITKQAEKRNEPNQEWKLLREGIFECFESNGSLKLKLIDSSSEESFYKMEGKFGDECEIIIIGSYESNKKLFQGYFRKSIHLVYGRRYENLDLFPEAEGQRPVLLSFREGRKGLKAYPRITTDCPCKDRKKCKDILTFLDKS